MRTLTVSAGLMCTAVACLGGSAARVGAASGGGEEALVRGELLYKAHCAVCHGVDGRGDGPAAGDLRRPPADLTRLWRASEAEFPTQRVHQAIDGRLELAGHGTREMPIWGLTLRERSRDDAQEAGVTETIDDLVEFLRSIQVDSP